MPMIDLTKEFIEEAKTHWENDIDEFPDHVKKVALLYPMYLCYKNRENPGHYSIISYAESKDGSVGATIVHGSDSYLPGVYTVTPFATLIPCGCGNWKPPTPEQIQQTRVKLLEQGEEGEHDCGDPNCVMNKKKRETLQKDSGPTH